MRKITRQSLYRCHQCGLCIGTEEQHKELYWAVHNGLAGGVDFYDHMLEVRRNAGRTDVGFYRIGDPHPDHSAANGQCSVGARVGAS